MTTNEELIAEASRLIADCMTYNFGMHNADKLAHEIAPKLVAALAALITPQDGGDALEARQPSEDGEYILKLIETIKETGGSVEIHGVKIVPCDEFGRTAAVPDAATGELARIEKFLAGVHGLSEMNVVRGLRKVIAGEETTFTHEVRLSVYGAPCGHTPPSHFPSGYGECKPCRYPDLYDEEDYDDESRW